MIRIVIDTNRIIAALIKNNISRKIIFSKDFELITPQHSINEVYNYKNLIINKANINNEEFEFLIYLIFEKIKVIQTDTYKNYIKEGKKLIQDIDDVPFIALALAAKCDIWSDDKHFQKQKKIKIWKTADMLKLISK